MAKSQLRLIIGIVILAVGIVVGVYGIYLYNNLQSSVMNSLEKAFVGSTDAETQAIIFMGSGAVGAVLGLVILLTGGSRRGRGRRRR